MNMNLPLCCFYMKLSPCDELYTHICGPQAYLRERMNVHGRVHTNES